MKGWVVLALLALVAVGGCTNAPKGILWFPLDIAITELSLPSQIEDGSPYTVKMKIKNGYYSQDDRFSPWCNVSIDIEGKRVTGKTYEYVTFGPREEKEISLSFLANNNGKDTIVLSSVCASSNKSYYDTENKTFVGDVAWPTVVNDVRLNLTYLDIVKHFSEGQKIRINYDPSVPKSNPYGDYPLPLCGTPADNGTGCVRI